MKIISHLMLTDTLGKYNGEDYCLLHTLTYKDEDAISQFKTDISLGVVDLVNEKVTSNKSFSAITGHTGLKFFNNFVRSLVSSEVVVEAISQHDSFFKTEIKLMKKIIDLVHPYETPIVLSDIVEVLDLEKLVGESYAKDSMIKKKIRNIVDGLLKGDEK